MKTELSQVFETALATLGITDVPVSVMPSDMVGHGHYTTNIALLVAKRLGVSPKDAAIRIVDACMVLKKACEAKAGGQNTYQKSQTISTSDEENADFVILQDIERLDVAGPGFINVTFSEAGLSTHMQRLLKLEKGDTTAQFEEASHSRGDNSSKKPLSKSGQHSSTNSGQAIGGVSATKKRILVEYAHPNTHKAFHIGHLRNITTGECIARILTAVGNDVVRVNYQGDVGMHIGKALYGILHDSTADDFLSAKSEKTLAEKIAFLGTTYAAGSTAFETDETAKKEILDLNKKVYSRDPIVYPLYQQTRQWSLDYFAEIYARVGTAFDRLYFESETYESGKQLVLEGVTKGIFKEDDAAIIYAGEEEGLHNRVFVTKEGNPTYEAKDMGLGKLQFDEYHPDSVIHCVGPEQIGYFQVIIAALAKLIPETKDKEYHLVYGWVKLKEGKMSSRLGQVVLGTWLLDNVRDEIKNILVNNDINYTEIEQKTIPEACAIAAVKYSFLKVGTKEEIAFDLKESINIHGDSGPYLLYTYARCKSVLRKAGVSDHARLGSASHLPLTPEEHALLRLFLYYGEIIEEAASRYAPNVLCSYIFQLAQAFNLFYQKCPILESSGTAEAPLDHATSQYRLALTEATSRVLQHGLNILGIQTVEKM